MDNEIMYTSNVDEILKLFLERNIYISTGSWMMKTFPAFISNSSNKVEAITISKGYMEFHIAHEENISVPYSYTDRYSKERIAKDVVVCYDKNSKVAMMLYDVSNIDFLTFNMHSDNGITKNMLIYFMSVYGFITDDIDMKEYRGRSLKFKGKYEMDGSDIIIICGFPVNPTPKDNMYKFEGKTYVRFDENGTLISHRTSMSPLGIMLKKISNKEEKEISVRDGTPIKLTNSREGEKDDEPDEESVEGMVESIIEALTALRNMMSDDKEVLDDFFSQYYRQYYKRE